MSQNVTLDQLRQLVEGEAVAIRGRAVLEPAFPSVPAGSRIVTCGVTGRRQDELRFHWPLWSCGASYATVRSLLLLTASWIEKDEKTRRKIEAAGSSGRRYRLQGDLERAIDERRRRGVFAICTSGIRRTAQGFGNLVQLVFRAKLNSLACIHAGSREASFIYVILDIRNRGSDSE